MTADQQFILAIFAQLAVLITAAGAVWIKLESLHHQVNSRMDQLLELTATSSEALGQKKAADASSAAAAGPNAGKLEPTSEGPPAAAA